PIEAYNAALRESTPAKTVGPLVRVELARRAADAAVPEAVGDESVIVADALGRDERPLAPAHDEHARVDRRRRLERRARQAPRERHLVERAPDDAAHAARPRHRPLERDAPLDDEIGPRQRRVRIVEQPVQQIGGAMERQVRDDAKRRARQRDARGVALDDAHVRPAAAETRGEARIELDRDDRSRDAAELSRQAPAARAEVDDELVVTNARVADDLRRDTSSQEVPATRG